jgi:hypothetical protein
MRPQVLLCEHAAGWSSLVARRAHNPKVAGSNPAPATIRFRFARRHAILQLADQRFRDSLRQLSTRLSGEFIGALSKLPYVPHARVARCQPSTRWTGPTISERPSAVPWAAIPQPYAVAYSIEPSNLVLRSRFRDGPTACPSSRRPPRRRTRTDLGPDHPDAKPPVDVVSIASASVDDCPAVPPIDIAGWGALPFYYGTSKRVKRQAR